MGGNKGFYGELNRSFSFVSERQFRRSCCCLLLVMIQSIDKQLDKVRKIFSFSWQLYWLLLFGLAAAGVWRACSSLRLVSKLTNNKYT